MWLNNKEKDPAVFKEGVVEVCETYKVAKTLHEERGTRTMSTDEMTGIQALERSAPSQPMKPGQVTRDEFEYTRHGTTTAIANLDVVTGKLTARLGPTRTEEDYANFIDATVATDRQVEWVFIHDNLNTHCSATLVQRVAENCGITADLGVKGVSGILKNQASRREFLSDKSHRIRFVFLPKHSSWLNQIETVFGIIMRKVVRRGNFTSVADLNAKLIAFIAYYNETMAHPFNWTYTGKPLKTHRPDFCPPHRRRQQLSKIELAKLAHVAISSMNGDVAL